MSEKNYLLSKNRETILNRAKVFYNDNNETLEKRAKK